MIDWKLLAAPVPPEEIRWRADGKPKDGRVRAVAYTDSEFVRQRLDEACGPAGWQMALDQVQSLQVGTKIDRNTGEEKAIRMFFVACSLTLRDEGTGTTVTREDVGQGKDPKEAASDSLKRAAHRFGVAAELWRYPKAWAACDQYGNLLETPVGSISAALPRASAHPNGQRAAAPAPRQAAAPQQQAAAKSPVPPCPKCKGPMWDNREGKRNPKAPDFKCKDRSCVDDRGMVTGAWDDNERPKTTTRSKALVPTVVDQDLAADPNFGDEDDDLPF